MTDPLVLNPDDIAATAPEVFRRVWRTSLEEPGFALLRFSRPVDSRELRRAMVDLVRAFPVAFVPERFGRFDQQVSSKFHRDGAPPASLLVLGYEPTRVRSRFWVADVSAAAVRAGLSLEVYLKANNPMFPAGEAALAPFVTELALPHGAAVKPGFAGDRPRDTGAAAVKPGFAGDRPRDTGAAAVKPGFAGDRSRDTSEPFVIVANNSQLPHGNGNPLGVLHKAVIESPDPNGTRVINSIGFTPRTANATGLPEVAAEGFLARDGLD